MPVWCLWKVYFNDRSEGSTDLPFVRQSSAYRDLIRPYHSSLTKYRRTYAYEVRSVTQRSTELIACKSSSAGSQDGWQMTIHVVRWIWITCRPNQIGPPVKGLWVTCAVGQRAHHTQSLRLTYARDRMHLFYKRAPSARARVKLAWACVRNKTNCNRLVSRVIDPFSNDQIIFTYKHLKWEPSAITRSN